MDIPFITSYTLLGFLVLTILVLAFWGKRYYFIYDHRLLFVIVLIFSRSLAYHAVTDVIMWYVSYYEDGGFVRSAILSNIQDALSSLFVIFVAHSADSSVGRFRVLVFSTTAYISGLLILWIFNPYDVTWLIVVAIVLLALGESGGNVLKNILTDLVDGIDTSVERTKKRSLARGAIWWRIAYASCSIAAILWVAPDAFGGVQPTWRTTFLVCLTSMIAALIVFCIGHKVYQQGELTQRPVEIFLRVFRAKLQKLCKSNSRCPMNSPEQERSPETRRKENEGITKDRSPLHLDTNEKKYRGKSSYTDDIKVVRSLLRMLPMWGTLIVVWLTAAAGSTFYIEQFSNLRGNEKIPAQMFGVIHDFSAFAILMLYSCTCFHENLKLKIGVGMLCSIISCIFAGILEHFRLKEIYKKGDDEYTSISFLWLVPQFCFLGCMEGLTEEGSLEFFKSQTDEPIRSYCEEYMKVVMCLGELVNIILVSVLDNQLKWFGYDVNNGTCLDKYYLLLVCLCSVNFIIYCCIAKYFYKGTGQNQGHSAHDNSQLRESSRASTLTRARWNRIQVLLSRQVSIVLDYLS